MAERQIFSIAAVAVLSFLIAFVTDHTAVFVIQKGIEKVETKIRCDSQSR